MCNTAKENHSMDVSLNLRVLLCKDWVLCISNMHEQLGAVSLERALPHRTNFHPIFSVGVNPWPIVAVIEFLGGVLITLLHN